MPLRDAAPVILKMPPSLVGSPVLRRGDSDWPARADPRRPLAEPPRDWFERWTVSFGGVVVPVEFYSRGVPAGPPRHLESRTIVTTDEGGEDLLHLGVRFGRVRREA